MSTMQRVQSSKLTNGLPLAPSILINNAVDTSNIYADALCSLIPHSRVFEPIQPLASFCENNGHKAISIWPSPVTVASQAAKLARDCQVKALKRGRNMAFIYLCNDSTWPQFLAVPTEDWPTNHRVINVETMSSQDVAKGIVRWLFTVFSVRESLHLIPESEMLEIDTKNYAEYEYCALMDARKQSKTAKVQFVALVASKPELTEPNKLTWRVVDRSGEGRFYFHHRGPSSQHTWEWVLSLKPGDRKVLPRMPMVALHEPMAKKILLSPLRVTGATIRGVGHVTMGIGKGVHWVGNKVSFRRSEEQKYMPEVVWREKQALKVKKKKEEEEKKQVQKNKKCCAKRTSLMGTLNTNMDTKKDNVASDFKIFNEKGEKTWKDMEDDTASTIAASSVDVKVEKEFC